MHPARIVSALALGLTVVAARPAAAQLVASTFGPGSSYNEGVGYALLDDPAVPNYQAAAVSFIDPLPGAHQLDRIRVGILVNARQPTIAQFLAGPDINSATLLESFSFAQALGTRIVTLTSALHPVLATGQTYWLALLPSHQGEPHSAWMWNDQGITGWFVQHAPGGPWLSMAGTRPTSTTPAYDVTAAPVPVVPPPVVTPEPASVILIAGGLAVLGVVRRRRPVH
jgi:hypothetical protein